MGEAARMSTHKKDRIGCNRATFHFSIHAFNFTKLSTHIKSLIVNLVPWDLLLVRLVDWLTHWGESHYE